jgi:hypothetical protein
VKEKKPQPRQKTAEEIKATRSESAKQSCETSKLIQAAKGDPLWAAFDGWVVASGQAFTTSRNRLIAWTAFKAGYENGRINGRF